MNIKHSLLTKLTLLIVSGVLGITLVLSSMFIGEFRSSSAESAQTFIVESTRHLRDQILEQLQQRVFLLEYTAMGALPLIKQAAVSEEERLALQNYCEKMAKMLPNVLSLFGSSIGPWTAPGNFFVSGDGWYPNPDYDNTTRSWFTMGKAAGGRIVFTDPYLDMVTKKLTVALTKTVFDERGTPAMVLAEDTSISTLDQIANAAAAMPEIKSYILHSSGRYISNPNAEAVMEKDFFTDHNLEQFRNQAIGSQSFFGTNGKVFICSEPISLADWNLVTIIPVDAVFADVNRVTRNSIFISAGTLLFFILILSLVIRKIVSPIKYVSNQLKAISEGEGDLTKHITVSSNDEIGDLTRYFNRTLEKIKAMVVIIKNRTCTLSDIGTELASNMAQTAQGIARITNSIHSIKSGAAHQSVTIVNTQMTMEQIVGMIDTLNAHVDSQGVKVQESSEAIESIIGNIQAVTETLNRNTASLKDLAEASEIGKTGLQEMSLDIQEIARESAGLLEINGVMENIAGQTNLLSMNAAIEAAHAGEAGKGFAVVADEIRKLAESSGEQSKTIAAVLTHIKGSIDKITNSAKGVLDNFEAIDLGVKTVSEQAAAIRNAMDEQNLRGRKIVDVIETLEESTRVVKTGTAEMLENSKSIINESRSLGDVTDKIAHERDGVVDDMDKINFSVTRINTISGENKESIDVLVAEVEKFKVE